MNSNYDEYDDSSTQTNQTDMSRSISTKKSNSLNKQKMKKIPKINEFQSRIIETSDKKTNNLDRNIYIFKWQINVDTIVRLFIIA